MFEEKYTARVLLRHYCKVGLSVRAATNAICGVEGIGTSQHAAREWCKRFNQGDTSLEDKPRSGHPTQENDTLFRRPAFVKHPISGTSNRSWQINNSSTPSSHELCPKEAPASATRAN